MEVGRSFGWDCALEFASGTSIEPGCRLLVGESFATNADVSATLNIPNRNSSGWPTGVRLVWSGATNGSVVDVVMLGGNTNYNLAEMGQNSNPGDSAVSTPHDYTSHFESSSPGWTNGRVDNDIGFRGWVKQVFDSVSPGSCIGVKVTEGNVQEEFE